MPIWYHLGPRKLSSERLCIQSWFKGWKSFYKFAKNADFFYDIVDFFVLSNIAQSSANLVRGCSCSNSGQTLIPRNEARPINPLKSTHSLFHFLPLVSFLARPKPVFLCYETKRKRLLRRLFQMFRCSRKFSAGTTRPKKPCFILIYRRIYKSELRMHTSSTTQGN